MTGGERIARSSEFYPGALRFADLIGRKPPQAKQAAAELDLFTAIGDEEIRACGCG